nr:PREDICTED: uncharacterized protein LOC105668124 [Linepithema humile]
MAEIIITKKNVWQYYEKVSDYKVKCRFCRQKYTYVKLNFREHIINNHSDIKKYEETHKGRQEWPWICFKYNDTSTSQCLFCRENIESDFKSLKSHLHQKHVNEVKNYVLYDWIWKYCTRNNFKIKCTYCSEEFSIYLQGYNLKIHIERHSEELRNVRERCDIVLSSESVNISKSIELNENMWVYYNKLPFFRAKCKWENCAFECDYINDDLLSHIRKNHEAIYKWEREDGNKKSCKYLKYWCEYIFDKEIPHSECLMCGEFLTVSESIETHISEKHSVEEERYIVDDHWTMKYFRESDDNDEVKCTICCKKITINFDNVMFIHTMRWHLKELQSIISKKATDKLRDNDYTLKDFKATCRICGIKSCYIDTANFNKYVKEKHIDIYNYEKEHGHMFPWMHFTYLTSYSLKCRCNKVFEFNNEFNNEFNKDFLKKHLDDHPFEYFFNPSLYESWEWKYCTQISDFAVQCNICSESRIPLDIPLWYFDRHTVATHSNSLTTTQRTHDAARP